MIKKHLILATISLGFIFYSDAQALLKKSKLNPETEISKGRTVCFIENKGQVHDQDQNKRPDILFSGADKNMIFHLKKDGISYQLNRIDSWIPAPQGKFRESHSTEIADKSTIYRVDINWLNANKNPNVIKGKTYDGFDNYYIENSTHNIVDVKSFENIMYENIYAGIDLKWYQKDGHLKYDYIVNAGSDYKQIQLELKGADNTSINGEGELVITTPLGQIIEQAPLVIQNGKSLPSKWLIKNVLSKYHDHSVTSTILTFDIQNLDLNQDFVIDPAVRVWGTYYGGGEDWSTSCATDANGNVFIAGYTKTNTGTSIATAGSHQSTMSGVNYAAYLAKFNSSGVRQWGTYYGGAGTYGNSCAVDASGNVFLAGHTYMATGTVIATSGSHQPLITNTYSGFLVKFNSAGVRQWGTYYGANNSINMCATDLNGNVYIVGSTSSPTGIATPGSHQPAISGSPGRAYLAKFDASGVRLWGTYYGDTYDTQGTSCATDPTGNIYMSGYIGASTGTAIATVGSHQFTQAGGRDAFLVKFDAAGTRIWGTYYGGSADDSGSSCTTDANGNVYLFGRTISATNTLIATVGSHQPSFGGGADAFLVKFNPNGLRKWGTYYGGTGIENASNCTTDLNGNVFIAGDTQLSTALSIATPGSHQTSTSGGGVEDGYLVQLDSTGTRQWGTYYGGNGYDFGTSCAVDANNNVFLAGYTNTGQSGSIGTTGSHQATFPMFALNTAFLVKFFDCGIAASPSSTNQSSCNNSSFTLSAVSGTNIIKWYAFPSSGSILSTGNTYITPVLGTGTYTYYAEAISCMASLARTPVIVTVNPIPVINVSSGSICIGQSYSIVPSGASTYTFEGGSSVVNPTSTSDYTVIGTSSAGCVSTTFAISNVTVNSLPIISIQPNLNALCIGQTMSLSASGANNYTWSTGATNSVIVIMPPTTTSYSVTGTDINGCSNFTSTIIVVNSLPTVNIQSSNGTICSGQTVSLMASGANSYTWGAGAITPVMVVTPTATASYSVTGMNINGCTNHTTTTISVNSLPTVSIQSSANLLCIGESVILTASGANSYSWNTAATGATIAVTPANTTTYNLIGEDLNGCTNTASFTQSVSACSGLNHQVSNYSEIKAYPNPFNERIIITPVEKGKHITISNIIGAIVFNKISEGGDLQVNLEKLVSGIYFIGIDSLVIKIVKQ